MNKRDFRKMDMAAFVEAILKLLFPEATLSEALTRVEFVEFDESLKIGEFNEKPEGYIFRNEITNLYLMTEKSLINISSTQGLRKANLSWFVDKLVNEELYVQLAGEMISTVLLNYRWEKAIAVRYIVTEDSHFNLSSRLEISFACNN